jgi:hypothetical protein
MASSAERAETLARRVRALRDPSLRIAHVRRELAGMDPATAADVLTVISARAQARQDHHAILLLAVSLALSDDDAAPLRRALSAAATLRGQEEVAALFAVRSSQETAEPADPDAPPAPLAVPDTERPLTLGERKALARRADRNLIARAVRDPDPHVIRILLHNPALTEDDVVRLCARRPVAAAVLREVFRAPRWIARYRVRHALLRNPHSPLDLALQMAPHLTEQDARAASLATELHDELRLACRRAGTPIH